MVISFEDRIEREVQALSKEFSGQVPGEQVHPCVKESVASLQPARLIDFVPGFKFCGECAMSLTDDSNAPVAPSGSEITQTTQPSPFLKEDPKEIAMGVAREWTRSSIDRVSSMRGLAVTQGTPMLDKVASSIIENQIKQKVEWTFSDPENLAEGRCRVVASASAPLEVGLLTFKWRSTASADFELSLPIRTARYK